MSPAVSIIVPCFNESRTVSDVVRRLGRALDSYSVASDVGWEIIVVDDGSTDGSSERIGSLLEPRVRLIRHATNVGKGAAVRTGILHSKGKYLVIQDADLEYEPECCVRLLCPLLAGRASVVYGSRFLGSMPKMLAWQRAGNRAITWLVNILTGVRSTDIATGQKAFVGSLLRGTLIRSRGFGFDAEVTVRLLRDGTPGQFTEVPVPYRARSRHAGKKLTPIDGIVAAVEALRARWEAQQLPHRSATTHHQTGR